VWLRLISKQKRKRETERPLGKEGGGGKGRHKTMLKGNMKTETENLLECRRAEGSKCGELL
jgi:hypothetical protein